jgi:hypothetical protein
LFLGLLFTLYLANRQSDRIASHGALLDAAPVLGSAEGQCADCSGAEVYWRFSANNRHERSHVCALMAHVGPGETPRKSGNLPLLSPAGQWRQAPRTSRRRSDEDALSTSVKMAHA